MKIDQKFKQAVARTPKSGENNKEEITMSERDATQLQTIAHVRKKDREFQTISAPICAQLLAFALSKMS